MRKIDILINEAKNLYNEYETKVRNLDETKWNKKDLINSIIAYYECSDDIATASRAFWAEESLKKDLDKKGMIELFNEAKSIEDRRVIELYNHNKDNSKYLWDYEFDYNKVCNDIKSSIDSMIKYYEDFLNYKELDGEINGYYVYKRIEEIYKEYVNFTRTMSMVRKSEYFNIVENAIEKELVNDQEIDAMLNDLYVFDKSSDNHYMRPGCQTSDYMMYNILKTLEGRLEKLPPVRSYDYTGDSERHSQWIVREYINHKFSFKLYNLDMGWDVKYKIGSVIKYFLKEISKLKNQYIKNNSTLAYRHSYDKIREDISIFYKGC